MRILLLIICAIWLAPTSVVLTPGDAAAAKKPMLQAEYPFPADDLRRQLIRARIYSRTGQYPRALKAYRSIVKKRPNDRAVREQFIESIIQNRDFALAKSMLDKWLHDEPDNTAALRLMGVMSLDTNQPRRATHYYERMIALRPGDTDAIASSAYAHLAAGDWVTALNRFSEVLDHDPDNGGAREAVMSILEQRAPRLDLTFDITTFAQDARITSWLVAWSQQLDDQTRFDFDTTIYEVDRPSGDGTTAFDTTGQYFHARLTRTIDFDFDIIGGVGFSTRHEGSSALSQELGFNWRPRAGHELSVLLARSAPYSTSVDGSIYKMTYDDLTATYTMFIDDKWALSAGGTLRQYGIENGANYAYYTAGTASVGRRIWRNPDVFLTYSYLRSRAGYENDNNTPVTFLTREAVHSLTMSYEHIVTTLFSYNLSAGARYDEHKSYVSFFGDAGFLVKFCRRLQWRTSFGYTSDSDTGTAGGVSTNFNTSIRVLF